MKSRMLASNSNQMPGKSAASRQRGAGGQARVALDPLPDEVVEERYRDSVLVEYHAVFEDYRDSTSKKLCFNRSQVAAST